MFVATCSRTLGIGAVLPHDEYHAISGIRVADLEHLLTFGKQMVERTLSGYLHHSNHVKAW